MNSLLLFLAGTIVIALLFAVVALNFSRFRFKGDKTLLFIALFAAALVATFVYTVFLFIPEAGSTNTTTESETNFFP